MGYGGKMTEEMYELEIVYKGIKHYLEDKMTIPLTKVSPLTKESVESMYKQMNGKYDFVRFSFIDDKGSIKDLIFNRQEVLNIIITRIEEAHKKT